MCINYGWSNHGFVGYVMVLFTPPYTNISLQPGRLVNIFNVCNIMGIRWYVLIGSINNVYDRCHSHNPTITDVKNPSYSYEGYRYLCKDGNNRIGTGNAFNVLLLIKTPIYFLSNWCGKNFKPKMCCKGVQSNFMETAAYIRFR